MPRCWWCRATTTSSGGRARSACSGSAGQVRQVRPLLRRAHAGAGDSRARSSPARSAATAWPSARSRGTSKDVAVKGHLPAAETDPGRRRSSPQAPAGAVRILTFHHNVLAGGISRRMGLANWRSALPAAPRHRRRRDPLRARSPRGGGADRGRAGREHRGHPQLPYPRRPSVGLQSRQDRRPRGAHPALPLGGRRPAVSSRPT